MGMLPSAFEIVFEMERKKSNEKRARRKKESFPTCETRVCFLLFGPLLLSKTSNFLISCSF
jgi:hypothetical protein